MKSKVLNTIHYWFGLTAPLTLGLFAGGIAYGLWSRQWAWVALGLVAPYTVPLGLYRLMESIAPQREGATRLVKGVYHPWAVSFRIQYFHYLFPQFEDVLKALPGAYPAWLRLWGAKVGERVFIAAGVFIMDRGMVEIGDDVTFGFGTVLSPHMVRFRKDRKLVYLKKIRIGSGAFVGGKSYLGPGSEIGENHFLPGFSTMAVNMKNRYMMPVPEGMDTMPLDADTPDERRAWLKKKAVASAVLEAGHA